MLTQTRNGTQSSQLHSYTSTNSSLGLDRGVKVARSKKDKDNRDSSVKERLYNWLERLVPLFYILSEIWLYDFVDL